MLFGNFQYSVTLLILSKFTFKHLAELSVSYSFALFYVFTFNEVFFEQLLPFRYRLQDEIQDIDFHTLHKILSIHMTFKNCSSMY